MSNVVIQSLWIGPRLSVMEQLSIRSYLDQGYAFHLYTYGDVLGVPAGAVLKAASEILPAQEIFCYQSGYGKGSYAAFANGFRYKLLLERGGWWSDLDSVCMRPLDFAADHVLGQERIRGGGCQLNSAMIKASAGSPLMAYCWEACRNVDRENLRWGEIGPRLVTEAVRLLNMPVLILEPSAFYPIDYWQVWHLIRQHQLPANAHVIHLWQSQWRWQQLDPDAAYPPTCIYEQLKRRFHVASSPYAGNGPTLLNFGRYQLKQLRAGVRAGLRKQPNRKVA